MTTLQPAKSIVLEKYPAAACKKVGKRVLYEVTFGRQKVRAFSAVQAWKNAARKILGI